MQNKEVSAIKKGNSSEDKTKQYFHAIGFNVWNAHRQKFRSNDFFSKFDHAAVTQTLIKFDTVNGNTKRKILIPKGVTVWIQTKTNRMPGTVYRNMIANFVAEHKMIVIWHDGKDIPEVHYYDIAGQSHRIINLPLIIKEHSGQ